MQALLTQQAASLSVSQHNKLTSLQAEAFANRAAQLTDISIDEVQDLTSTIQNGPWQATEQQQLIMALANALAGATHEGSSDSKVHNRPSQHLTHFQNYTTSDEKAKLMDPDNSMIVKIPVVLDVLSRIHAVLLTEPSKRHVLATLCSVHSQQAWEVDELRSWYVAFKKDYTKRFKGQKADTRVGHLRRFPEHPNMLTDSKRGVMFTDETGAPDPLSVELTRVHHLENNIWCRGDAVALRTDVVRGNTQVSRQPSAPAMDMQNPMQAMCSAMMTMMMNSARQSPRQASGQEMPIQFNTPSQGAAMRAGSSSDLLAIDDSARPNLQSPRTPARSVSISSESQSLTPSAIVAVQKPATLTPQQQADKFLAALQGETVDDEDDDEDDDKGSPTDKQKAKGKAKARGKAKAKAKAKGKAKAKATACSVKKSGKAKDLVFSPSIALEGTRKQYLFRPGLTFAETGESSKSFGFSQHGGKIGACKAAEKHMKEFKATHTCK